MCGCGDKGLWRSSLLLLIAVPVWAHVVSMSTGELRVDGPLADYELRIPMMEIAQMANPASILDYIQFDGGHRTSAKCADEDGTYVCHASYEFETLVPDRLGVECRFFEVTVPNHVHWLHAMRGANSDQEVFDQAFPRSELRFRPPSRIEIFWRQFGLGFAAGGDELDRAAVPDRAGDCDTTFDSAVWMFPGRRGCGDFNWSADPMAAGAAILGVGDGSDGGLPGGRDSDGGGREESIVDRGSAGTVSWAECCRFSCRIRRGGWGVADCRVRGTDVGGAMDFNCLAQASCLGVAGSGGGGVWRAGVDGSMREADCQSAAGCQPAPQGRGDRLTLRNYETNPPNLDTF